MMLMKFQQENHVRDNPAPSSSIIIKLEHLTTTNCSRAPCHSRGTPLLSLTDMEEKDKGCLHLNKLPSAPLVVNGEEEMFLGLGSSDIC